MVEVCKRIMGPSSPGGWADQNVVKGHMHRQAPLQAFRRELELRVMVMILGKSFLHPVAPAMPSRRTFAHAWKGNYGKDLDMV